MNSQESIRTKFNGWLSKGNVCVAKESRLLRIKMKYQFKQSFWQVQNRGDYTMKEVRYSK